PIRGKELLTFHRTADLNRKSLARPEPRSFGRPTSRTPAQPQERPLAARRGRRPGLESHDGLPGTGRAPGLTRWAPSLPVRPPALRYPRGQPGRRRRAISAGVAMVLSGLPGNLVAVEVLAGLDVGVLGDALLDIRKDRHPGNSAAAPSPVRAAG